MQRYNNYVHYIWVGPNPIPDNFKENYVQTKEKNPSYDFVIWQDQDILEILPNFYEEKYDSLSLFHKLQIGRYNVANKYGGIVCDFDITWKETFDQLYEWFPHPTNMIFPYRRSVYFYEKNKQSTLADDFVFLTKPNLTSKFLEYCENNKDKKSEFEEAPYSVWHLTEWLLTQENIKYISPKQISSDMSSISAVHDNKKTWKG